MDLERLKKKLDNLENSGGSGNGGYRMVWKPTGKHTIRIVPFKHDPDWPFLELDFHYEVPDRPCLSPVSFDEPDPIVEFCQQLERQGGDNWKRAQKLKPKRRTYVPIIVRGEEDQGIKFWGFGKTIFKQLIETINDPDYGDITNPQTGRDIVLTYTPVPPGGTGFPETSILVKPNVGPMISDKSPHLETVKESLKNTPTIEELWTKPTYEDLKQALETYLEDMSDGDDNDNQPSPKATTTQKVNAAFDDIFGGKSENGEKKEFEDLPF